ncbi:HIRAN domain-containing protein, partial [Geobacillus sp. AYS3]
VQYTENQKSIISNSKYNFLFTTWRDPLPYIIPMNIVWVIHHNKINFGGNKMFFNRKKSEARRKAIDMGVHVFPLKGTDEDEIQKIIPSLDVNTNIYLSREKQHFYGKNTIVVYEEKNNQKIGYIPEKYAELYASIIDAGINLYAKIIRTFGNNEFSVYRPKENIIIPKNTFPFGIEIAVSNTIQRLEGYLKGYHEGRLEFNEVDSPFKKLRFVGSYDLFGFYKNGVTKVTLMQMNPAYVLAFIASNTIETLTQIEEKTTLNTVRTFNIENAFTEMILKYTDNIINKRGNVNNDDFSEWIKNKDIKISNDEYFLHNSMNVRLGYIINLDTKRLEIYSGLQSHPNYTRYLKIERHSYSEGYYNCKLLVEVDLDLIPKEWIEVEEKWWGSYMLKNLPVDWIEILKKKMYYRYDYDDGRESIWSEYNEDGLPYEDMK